VALTLGRAGRVLLLDPPYDRLLPGLQQARPELAEGAAKRPITTVAEIARAAQLLDEAAHVPALFAALGLTEEAIGRAVADSAIEPSAVRFGTLARTLVANELLGRGLTLTPLPARDVAGLVRVAGDARSRGETALRTRLDEKKWEYPPAFARWLDAWLTDFTRAPEKPDGLLLRLT
jgi:hypothetical protein